MLNKVTSYKELVVWQKSMDLVKRVYEVTRLFPEEEKFGLTSQIRRSAVSIPSNIAEGWGRGSLRSCLNFLRIAQGSLFELETQIYIAKGLGFSSDSHIEELISEIGKMIGSMIFKMKSRDNIQSDPKN
ncbi:four helix bundle protein [Capnocytophaga canimorsus]|uniref:four helix bundle protein n=1 Tax=Capnocytophaga canimorsus TaxID=28188 RepID=UPI00385DEE00